MQPPFPTKKFFIVLLFLILAAGGTFKFFRFLHNRIASSTLGEQKLATQNTVLPRQVNITGIPTQKTTVATSTLTAVAAVAYLSEQTKANGATMDQITASVGKQIQDAKDKLDGDTYLKSDITTGEGDSPDALKKYANDMAEIFIKTSKDYDSKETYLTIVKNALEKKDPNELKKLDPYISFYKKVIADSLKLPVPPSAVSIHLGIINSYAQTLALIQGFQSTSDDLPSAIASNARIQKSSIRFMNSCKDAGDFFVANGVTFSQEEKGNLFAVITQGYIKR
jgi:hypothetical protein